MALRNQPYLPLYVDDFTSDEKLLECSASTHGVYIRLICLMHKSDPYGKILLKQKYKQTDKQINNFATQVAKGFPFDVACVLAALTELVEEGVVEIDGDYLVQKRMVKDALISDKRANSGKKGGSKTQSKNQNFAKAKSEANTGLDMDTVNEDEINIINASKKILTDFGFNEISGMNKLRQIKEAISHIYNTGRIEYFMDQYENYMRYKKEKKERVHGLENFFDFENQFENPGWDSNTWSLLITQTSTPDKMTATVNAFAKAENPFRK